MRPTYDIESASEAEQQEEVEDDRVVMGREDLIRLMVIVRRG